MASAIQHLLSIIDLEALEVNLFRGRYPRVGWPRVFGGQLLGQGMVAACRTVEAVGERLPHSLHAYFLHPGDPKLPILYEVERLRDGASFSTRRVSAIQLGRPICAMIVSFHITEPGLEHQFPMPDVPGPEGLPSELELKQGIIPVMPEPVRRYYARERPIEMRPVEIDRYLGTAHPEGRFHVWIRTTGRLPDDPAIHRSVLAYATDLMLLDSTMFPHGRSLFEKSVTAASLDHAVWFHRPFRMDEWLLYAQDAPNTAGALGLGRGLVFTRDGRLVASVMQEGLIREKKAGETCR